ncbi:hypothetical protein [Butyrivibrio sp. LB2008]|uniref:hypothetical protein n=1 Tax=Butyrivibrio sp. LB2008 TaxID=1408305 RepID=UPI00047B8E5D
MSHSFNCSVIMAGQFFVGEERKEMREEHKEELVTEAEGPKNKIIKVFLLGFLAIVAGVGFETIYWAVGDAGLGFLDDCLDYLWKYNHVDFYSWFFFIYYVGIVIAGIILILSRRKKSGGMINLVTITIAIFSAIYVHFLFIAHDSVVYYQLHREFYPEVDDLGYFYFALCLGSVYPIWILTIIIAAFLKKCSLKSTSV